MNMLPFEINKGRIKASMETQLRLQDHQYEHRPRIQAVFRVQQE
jgi:hypothetical protein